MEPHSIHNVIETVVNLMHIKAENHGTKIEFEGFRAGDKKVEIDQLRVQQILINLVDNAIKYSL